MRTVAHVGALIRRLRRDRDWSQSQLAEAAGVSRVFISQLENGKARAEMRLVLATLQAVGASIIVTQSEPGDGDDLLMDQQW